MLVHICGWYSEDDALTLMMCSLQRFICFVNNEVRCKSRLPSMYRTSPRVLLPSRPAPSACLAFIKLLYIQVFDWKLTNMENRRSEKQRQEEVGANEQ